MSLTEKRGADDFITKMIELCNSGQSATEHWVPKNIIK
jgi:hypothetical protein